MPREASSSRSAHKQPSHNPYARNGSGTKERSRTLSSKEEKEVKKKDKERKALDLESIKQEMKSNGLLQLQPQASPPKPTDGGKKKKKNKKKRKSSMNNNTVVPPPTPQVQVQSKQSVEDKLEALVRAEKAKEENPSKVMEQLEKIRAPAPSSSPEPDLKSLQNREEQGGDVNMNTLEPDVEDASTHVSSKGIIDGIPSNSPGKSLLPEKGELSTAGTSIISKSEKDRIRKRKNKDSRLTFVAEEKARMEEEEKEAILSKQREELRRIAEMELEKIKNETEKTKKEVDKLQKELKELEKKKQEQEANEKNQKIRNEEDKKRKSEQELMRIREEKRKYKELQDKVEQAENDLKEYKSKIENEKNQKESKESSNQQLIENLRKDAEDSKKKHEAHETLITHSKNVNKAIVQALECGICLATVNDPYVLSCGHMACKGCLVEWFRSPTALKHEHYLPITPDTDLSYRSKLCFVCRSIVLRRPAKAFFLRAVLEPLGLFEHKDAPNPENEVDDWAKIFPPEQTSYKVYERDADGETVRCPNCMGEIYDSVCTGCDIEFSDESSFEDFDDLDEDGEEASVHGSILGSDEIIVTGGPRSRPRGRPQLPNFLDDEAEDDGNNSDSDSDPSDDSSDEEGHSHGSRNPRSRPSDAGRRVANGAAPPPPTINPHLERVLNMMGEHQGYYGESTTLTDEEDEDGDEDNEEREPTSEDEYGGSFIDDNGEGGEDDDNSDVSMNDDEVDESPPPRSSRSTGGSRSRRVDPDEVAPASRSSGTRKRTIIVVSDEEDE
ncbi:uncharacterized protein L201_007444 [Kwoniella dendrophila CBS 6074]|uniref:RING-type domain-containing protein n=1 Tax=Kwoniella dendrophila CBS 6074 TaxID=1295534 RepID=A0AAX4K4E5_9TREE